MGQRQGQPCQGQTLAGQPWWGQPWRATLLWGQPWGANQPCQGSTGWVVSPTKPAGWRGQPCHCNTGTLAGGKPSPWRWLRFMGVFGRVSRHPGGGNPGGGRPGGPTLATESGTICFTHTVFKTPSSPIPDPSLFIWQNGECPALNSGHRWRKGFSGPAWSFFGRTSYAGVVRLGPGLPTGVAQGRIRGNPGGRQPWRGVGGVTLPIAGQPKGSPGGGNPCGGDPGGGNPGTGNPGRGKARLFCKKKKKTFFLFFMSTLAGPWRGRLLMGNPGNELRTKTGPFKHLGPIWHLKGN